MLEVVVCFVFTIVSFVAMMWWYDFCEMDNISEY